jgi:hypothetical protein
LAGVTMPVERYSYNSETNLLDISIGFSGLEEQRPEISPHNKTGHHCLP